MAWRSAIIKVPMFLEKAPMDEQLIGSRRLFRETKASTIHSAKTQSIASQGTISVDVHDHLARSIT
jgi:hypothetical protein